MFDLHVHTRYSSDGHVHLKDIVKFLRKKGFKGAAITDHNTVQCALQKHRYPDFVVIPGIEVSTEGGHILGLGISRDISHRDMSTVVDELHAQGALAVLAHPYRWHPPNVQCQSLNGVETFNARSFPHHNARAQNLARTLDVPETGGSDAHYLFEVGRGYTVMDAECVDDALSEIAKGHTHAGGVGSFIHPLKCAALSFSSYVQRGFKRI